VEELAPSDLSGGPFGCFVWRARFLKFKPHGGSELQASSGCDRRPSPVNEPNVLIRDLKREWCPSIENGIPESSSRVNEKGPCSCSNSLRVCLRSQRRGWPAINRLLTGGPPGCKAHLGEIQTTTADFTWLTLVFDEDQLIRLVSPLPLPQSSPWPARPTDRCCRRT
jgi:hypothetical protein